MSTNTNCHTQVIPNNTCDAELSPVNYGPCASFDGHACITGSCGDTMEFWLTLHDGLVDTVSFTTDGGDFSRICGDRAGRLIAMKPIREAANLHQQDIIDALGDHLPPDKNHCALLAASALRAACEDAIRNQDGDAATHQPSSETSCSSCGKTDCTASRRSPEESTEAYEERRQLQSRLCRIRHTLVVLSGKGGVGKSTVAVNLAMTLMLLGKRVGLLDVDIHGPSVPTMLGIAGQKVEGTDEGIIPVVVNGLKVMSVGFLLEDRNDAVIWRGPLKMAVIKQFLKDVVWGDLDYLIVDSPPGTGDEPLSIAQLLGKQATAVIVTTPQRVSIDDVRKSIDFCRKLDLPIAGIVENMSGFACPHCGEIVNIFDTGGGKALAAEVGVSFLGSIPIEPEVVRNADRGQTIVSAHPEATSARAFREIVVNTLKTIL